MVTKPQRQPYIQDIDVSGSTPTTYTITASVNPTDAGTVTGANTYNAGEQCSLTASPNAGYNFVDWTKDGEQVSTDETYTFTVTADEEYVANFELQTFDITAITDPEDGGVITITGDFTYGSEVTISVEPAENFVFQYWSENGDIISYETTYSLFAYEDRHLVAVLIDVTGVDENAQQAVSIYPNPVNDKLIIEAEETIGMVEIYNLTGAMVLNQECNSAKAELEVNELQSGIYFIKMTNNCNVVTRSFVKK